MATPKRRPSMFAGKSAAIPDPEPTTAPPAEPAAESSPASSAPRAPKPKAVKIGFYADPEDMARARGAWSATQREESDRSLSHFFYKAVMAEVERREQLYNGGAEFPPLDAGNVSPGRRAGVDYD